MENVKIEMLKGKTLKKVEKLDEDRLQFIDEDDNEYLLHHDQDCCEIVIIEDIIGDLDDLIGSPLLMAEETTNEDSHPEDYKPDGYEDSFTWTFYKLATIKGYVTIRWFGSSNGYYSERVDFKRI